MNKNLSDINNLSKIHWACRRGMLELDVLLSNFLEQAYHSLSVADKERFVALLSCSDPELFDWLMGHSSPEDADLALIVARIRQHAKRGL